MTSKFSRFFVPNFCQLDGNNKENLVMTSEIIKKENFSETFRSKYHQKKFVLTVNVTIKNQSKLQKLFSSCTDQKESIKYFSFTIVIKILIQSV
jgi:hypothetical protein